MHKACCKWDSVYSLKKLDLPIGNGALVDIRLRDRVFLSSWQTNYIYHTTCLSLSGYITVFPAFFPVYNIYSARFSISKNQEKPPFIL